MQTSLAPFVEFGPVEVNEANSLLVAFGHRIGPIHRPRGGVWAHALFVEGEPLAVTVHAELIQPTVATLPDSNRANTIELARLCAGRPDLCRVALRLWRCCVFEMGLVRAGYRMAISYQDEALHTGATYRNDGWKRSGRSHSGTDRRSGRKGRDKVVWYYEIPQRASTETTT